MKLQFILRTITDIKSHKNKTCWTCKHLTIYDMCLQPEPNPEEHEIINCPRYTYLRDYKKL